MNKALIGLGMILTALLCSCQTQATPKAVPVFDFRQVHRTVINPPSYYACGDVYFPCNYQQKVVIKKERHYVTSNSVQK